LRKRGVLKASPSKEGLECSFMVKKGAGKVGKRE
jgi:hypothetical protein